MVGYGGFPTATVLGPEDSTLSGRRLLLGPHCWRRGTERYPRNAARK